MIHFVWLGFSLSYKNNHEVNSMVVFDFNDTRARQFDRFKDRMYCISYYDR